MTSEKCLSISKKCNPSKFINFGLFPFVNFPINFESYNNFLKKNNYPSKKKLELLICKKCGYLFLKNRANPKVIDNIYSKFYKYPSALLKQITPTRDNFFLKKIFNILNFKKIKSILEIGCYDGYILSKIKKKYPKINLYGCEPSKGANIAIKFGLNIKKNFFNEKLYKGKKFDLIIIRHTLEHIYKIDEIIKNIKSVMKENTYLAIEVPNINFYLKNGLLEVFSFQHIHYFSSKSFKIISNDHNLKIFNIFETPENLIAILSKKESNIIENKINTDFKCFKNFKKKIYKNSSIIKKILSKYKQEDIMLWGAGGFAIAATNLYKIPVSPKTLIVDKDKSKKGLTINNRSTKIFNIDQKEIMKKKLIIITSYYSKQIIKDIKKLKINIDVLIMFPNINLKKIRL